MFSRKETAELRKEFWTALGQYLSPILSAEGEKINWINYKTGLKGLHFKMNAVDKTAVISVEINHPDLLQQQIIFEKFQEAKNIFYDSLKEEWNWTLHAPTEHGKTVSKIYKQIEGFSLMQKEHWPELISFFKPRIIALDEFWSNVKYSFDGWQ